MKWIAVKIRHMSFSLYLIKGRFLLLFIFPAVFFLFGTTGTTAHAKLYINEFMADNDSTIEDPNEPGSFEDWIEIYNSGNLPVSMGGMYLTDDPADPTQWQIPAGVIIPAGGYLIFWADNDEEQGDCHVGFKLDADGESISLFNTDGETLVDSVTFDVQLLDISYGRYPDGSGTWGFMAGTPGTANSPHNTPPAITGTVRTPVAPAAGEDVWVTCTVNDDNLLIGVTLTYKAGNDFTNISMSDDGKHHDEDSDDGIFGGRIPFQAMDTIVDYYVSAIDDFGAVAVDPVAAPAATYHYIVGYVPPPLSINEFMADNQSTTHEPGDPNSYEDWIEIYNRGDSDVDIGGMYLTDNLANPTQWQIPAGVTIPAGGYLFFWADNEQEQGDYHADFKLSKEGEEIGLFDTDAKINMPIDTMTFGQQFTDKSCGRIRDGEEPWVLSRKATPGYSNIFPVGSYPIIWTLSLATDSHTLISEMGNCVRAIQNVPAASGRQEAAYLFYGQPAGRNFFLEPDSDYTVSITSPCSFSTE